MMRHQYSIVLGLATVFVLVVLTWWEALSKRVGAPSALAKSYMREDK